MDILSIPVLPVKRDVATVASSTSDTVAELDEMPVRFGGEKGAVEQYSAFLGAKEQQKWKS